MANALSQTYSAKIAMNADGVPTGLVADSVKKENMFVGAIKATSAVITGDEVVIGAGRTLATGAHLVASAYLARYRAGLAFSWNPYPAEA